MAHKLARLLITAALCLNSSVAGWEAAGQTPTKPVAQDQVIKVNTELVEVRAVVTDKQGQIVSGLQQADFQLLENGKPQAISFFSVARIAGREKSAANQPTSNKSTPGHADAVKPSRERLSETPARTVVLFVDNLHLSVASLLQVKQALRRFIDEQLTEQDLVALVSSAGTLGLVEQLTRHRQVLRYAIARLNPGPAQRESLFTPYLAAQVGRDPEAMNVAIEILKPEEGLDGLPRPLQEDIVRGRANQLLTETAYQSQATLLTLKAVAERMAGLPGQRVIVLFSDGFTLYDRGGSQETGDLQAATSRAVRSGVAIYSIDARGLQPPAMFNASIGRAITNPQLHSFSSAAERDLENGLNALAKDTGGDAFFNTNDLRGALQQALDHHHLYYTLAYYPAEAGQSQQFRRITIRVKNHPEYTVQTPKGYLPSDLAKTTKEEAAATPEQRLMQAMLAPLSRSEIVISASADFIEGETDDAQVSLRINIEGDKLDYPQEDQKHILALELVMLIYDANGQRVDGKTVTIQGKVKPENLALVKQHGYSYVRRVALKPGLYQARIGVRELKTEHFGTVTSWVEVPNLTKQKLALSSVILLDALTTNPATSETPSSEPPSTKIVEGIRFYAHDQPIIYFFRVYQAAQSATEGLVMQTEFIQDGKSIAQSAWQPVSERQIGKDKKGLGVGGQIQLTGLKSGIYEMRVTVKDPGSKRTAQRTVAFGIE